MRPARASTAALRRRIRDVQECATVWDLSSQSEGGGARASPEFPGVKPWPWGKGVAEAPGRPLMQPWRVALRCIRGRARPIAVL